VWLHRCSYPHQTHWILYSSSPLVEEVYNKNTKPTSCYNDLRRQLKKMYSHIKTAVTLWWPLHAPLGGSPQSTVSGELTDPWQPGKENVKTSKWTKTRIPYAKQRNTFYKSTKSRCAWLFVHKLNFLQAFVLSRWCFFSELCTINNINNELNFFSTEKLICFQPWLSIA